MKIFSRSIIGLLFLLIGGAESAQAQFGPFYNWTMQAHYGGVGSLPAPIQCLVAANAVGSALPVAAEAMNVARKEVGNACGAVSIVAAAGCVIFPPSIPILGPVASYSGTTYCCCMAPELTEFVVDETKHLQQLLSNSPGDPPPNSDCAVPPGSQVISVILQPDGTLLVIYTDPTSPTGAGQCRYSPIK